MKIALGKFFPSLQPTTFAVSLRGSVIHPARSIARVGQSDRGPSVLGGCSPVREWIRRGGCSLLPPSKTSRWCILPFNGPVGELTRVCLPGAREYGPAAAPPLTRSGEGWCSVSSNDLQGCACVFLPFVLASKVIMVPDTRGLNFAGWLISIRWNLITPTAGPAADDRGATARVTSREIGRGKPTSSFGASGAANWTRVWSVTCGRVGPGSSDFRETEDWTGTSLAPETGSEFDTIFFFIEKRRWVDVAAPRVLFTNDAPRKSMFPCTHHGVHWWSWGCPFSPALVPLRRGPPDTCLRGCVTN